jgi:hypothetical protein
MSQAKSTGQARCPARTNACAFALAENKGDSNRAAPPSSARLIDIDGDGVADLLLDEGNSQSWLRADGTGRFVLMRTPAQAPRHTTGPVVALMRADLDGNGVPDLAFADKNTITFLLATSPGIFTQASFALAEPATAMALADLDHNGKADMISINRQRQSVTVRLGL